MGVAGADAVPCATSASRAAADRAAAARSSSAADRNAGTNPSVVSAPWSRDDGAETTSVVCAKLSASSSSSRIANVSPSAAPSAAARPKALSDGSDEPVSLDDARNVRSSSAAAMPSSVPAFPGPRVAPATTLLTAPSAASSDLSRAGVDGADAVANARDTASEALESARGSRRR